jgi:UDP-N-acetylglucosamine--N-acetylmuramyl-(pentapeptide) pyrophosphoryl-undecaprenol N-acetylglucosamine transferase
LPTLAVAEALKDKLPEAEIWYVGSNRVSDRELVEAAGYKFFGINSGKLRRYFDWQNIVDAVRVAHGWWQARAIIARFKPDVVFAKGGFVTLPVIVAAGQAGVPVIAHESDIVVGLSNRLGLKWVTELALAFPVEEVIEHTRGIAQNREKMTTVGFPVDGRLIQAPVSRPFANGKPIVLITGGSQGASFINQTVVQALPEILEIANIIHYTGRGDYPTILSYYRQLPDRYNGSWMVRGFDVEDFRGFLMGADVVVSRSGSFVMELETAGKAAVLVPLPTSASNHQLYNAEFLAGVGAAVLVRQQELTPDRLVAEISSLLNDSSKRQAMASKMKELGQTHVGAADRLAKLIIKMGVKHENGQEA